MEFLLGFFIGATLVVLSYRFVIKNSLNVDKKIKVRYCQSHIVEILRPLGLMPHATPKRAKKTQSSDYEDSQSVRVVMVDGQAYWIRDNVFYTADIDENYLINNDSTRRVDTMGMDKVQLEKIMIIVDKLTEGENHDDRNSRNT
jgi:hypothetical protein